MRYEQNDGSTIEGYEPISLVRFTQVVDNDVCCAKGCEGEDFASLLGGCADIERETSPPMYQISVGVEVCSSLTMFDVTYYFSTGETACLLSSEVTHSTEFNDPNIVLENCCDAAVIEYLDDMSPFTIMDVLSLCYDEFVLQDPSEVTFDVGANDGEGECTMLSGAFEVVYRNADLVEQLREFTGGPEEFPAVVDNRHCCLAYDEFGEINNGYDLTFACEEI